MSLNEDETRDLGDLEYLINDQQDYDTCASLVSDEDAVFRSIPMSSGPVELDFRGIGFEGLSTSKDPATLADAFAEQRPDLHEKKAQIEASIFDGQTIMQSPPFLDADMYCIVSKSIIFCKSSNMNKVINKVRAVIEKNKFFERVTRSNEFDELAHPVGSDWIWNLTHFSREKFSVDVDVMFWSLNDVETFAQKFRGCPSNANCIIEFQRLGGDSFAWLDLWNEIATDIEEKSDPDVRFCKNGEIPKRRNLDIDLLSDSDDDEAEDIHDTLAVLIKMCEESSLEGKLEGLQTMCRMCDDSGICKQMAGDSNFISYVETIFEEIHEICRLSSRPMPLLRCIISLVLSLVSCGKNSVCTGKKIMCLIASVLEDITCCQAARFEAAKLVLYLISHGIPYEDSDVVLEAVTVASSNKNSRLLVDTLSQIQQTIRSLSYR